MPPLRFTCSNCGERLSTAPAKVGSKVKCPACKHVILVPITAPPVPRSELDVASREDPTLQVVRPEPPPTESGPVELVYADEDRFGPSSRNISDSVVPLRRSIIFVQGFLLGLVAIVFFVFGVVVGGRSARQQGHLSNPQACVVHGTVSFVDSAEDRFPDVGAVVCIVPATRRPEQKLPAESLGPDAPQPHPDQLTMGTLQQLGGVYGRADAQGQFRLRLPATGRYYMLVVSTHAIRPRNEHPNPRDLAEMGRYFVPATALVQQYRYQWQLVQVTQDRKLDVVF